MSRYIEAECEVEEKKKRKRLKRRILESEDEDGDVGDSAAAAAEDAADAELRDGDDHASCAGSEGGGGFGVDQAELESDSASECSADLSEHESDRDFIDDGVVYDHDASGDELDALEKKCELKRMGLSRRELALQELEDGDVGEDDEFETVKALKMVRKMTRMAREKHGTGRNMISFKKSKVPRSAKEPSVTLKDILTMKNEMKEKKKRMEQRETQEANPEVQKKKKKLAAGEGDWSRFFKSLQCDDGGLSSEEEEAAETLDASKEAPVEIKADKQFQFIEQSLEKARDASIKRNTEKLMPELEKERQKLQRKLQKPLVKPAKVSVKKEDDGKVKRQDPKCYNILSFFKAA